MSLVVGYCHSSELSAFFHLRLLDLVIGDLNGPRDLAGHIAQLSGPRIASARNRLCEQFLARTDDPDWLLLLDTDMVFPPDVHQRLLAHADREQAPVVGALCYAAMPTGETFPTLYRLISDDSGRKVERVDRVPPRRGLVKVDATGAACLLVHRQALVAIHNAFAPRTAYVWFSDGETIYDGRRVEHGEDVGFALRCRALDIPVHVATDVEIGHAKTLIVDSDNHERWRWQQRKDGDKASARAYVAKLRHTPQGRDRVRIGPG